MSDTIVAALVGCITAIITSMLASWFSLRSIRSEYKTKYHLELITRQIQSCENLWSVLGIASRTTGEQRLIIYGEQDVTISMEYAKKIHTDLVMVFNSPDGLYFSRELRKAVFELRDYLDIEVLQIATDNENIKWSKTKTNYLDGLIQNLRIAIRHEIGLEDLRIAKENRPN